MDQMDAEIIKILCKDARTSFNKIGRMLGIGTDTVFRRFEKLKREGKISGSTVVLSSKAIGIQGWCGFFIKVKQGTDASIVKKELTIHSELYGLVQLLGEYDFYIEMGFWNFEELDAFVTMLRGIEGIVVIDPVLFASHDWPLPTLSTLSEETLDWFLNVKE